MRSALNLMTLWWIFEIFTLPRLADAQCRASDEVCEYWLHVEHRLTMMRGREAVYAQEGQLYMWDDVTASQPINVSEVITADGWEGPRLVIAVNGSIPGPPIEVRFRARVGAQICGETVNIMHN
ncbi:laccase-2 [Elysia marginata]|uniref:Laccase-2 n=1 Tax=Elysia marginata TaxID=1093978 RepID=A0AAV4EVE6_9GAST|nr:laccase-2 [Elysia marginata]